MLEIPGSTALSPFRIAKLLDRLVALDPDVTDLTSEFVHFVDAVRPLSVTETGVLLRLLMYGARVGSRADPAPADAAVRSQLVLVVPRAGTISPWSSKASDI